MEQPEVDVLVKDAFLVFLEAFQKRSPKEYTKIRTIVVDFAAITSDFIKAENEKTLNRIINKFMLSYIANYFSNVEQEKADLQPAFMSLELRLQAILEMQEAERRHAQRNLLDGMPVILETDTDVTVESEQAE